MQTAQETIGKPIISMDNGADVGKVRDLYFDPNVERLVGISLGGGGIFGARSRLIDLDQVAALGEDVVLIQGADSVQKKNETTHSDAWVSYSKLHYRFLQTAGGTPIGDLEDVTLNEDGCVLNFRLGFVHVSGPIRQSRSVPRAARLDVGNDSGKMRVRLAEVEEDLVAAAS